jgi:hypothetical protein
MPLGLLNQMLEQLVQVVSGLLRVALLLLRFKVNKRAPKSI